MKVAPLLVASVMIVGYYLVMVLANPWTVSRKEFNKRPPEQAFELILKRPVPAGVSELQATGEWWMAGANIWVRFRATPPMIRTLLKGFEPIEEDRKKLKEFSDGWDKTHRSYDPGDRLGWEQIHRAKRIDGFSRYNGDQLLWVDWDTNTVYLFHFNI